MRKLSFQPLLLLLMLGALILGACAPAGSAPPAAPGAALSTPTPLPQPVPPTAAAPQPHIPTPLRVTEPPQGAMVSVPLDMQGEYVNVRGGPGTEFPVVGRLEKGASAPAVGRLPSDWIMIQFPGGPEGMAWVYAGLVKVSGEIPDLSVPGSTQP